MDEKVERTGIVLVAPLKKRTLTRGDSTKHD